MATASDITLSTDESTGTSVFKPLTKSEGRVFFVARDDDISAASRTLSLLFRPESNTRQTNRFNASLAMPLKRSDGGSPATYTASDVARFNGEWVLPSNMSAAERAELGIMVRDLVAETAVEAATDDLDPPI